MYYHASRNRSRLVRRDADTTGDAIEIPLTRRRDAAPTLRVLLHDADGFKLLEHGAPSGRLSRYEAALYQRAKDGNPNKSWRSDTSSESWRSRL